MENILLSLFLLLIPTQLGRHFWPDWSLVAGIRVDYLSPTLYLIDVIWILLLITKLWTNSKPACRTGRFKIQNVSRILKNKWLWVGMGLVVINILVSSNKMAAGYGWLRIGQWLMTIRIIQNYAYRQAGSKFKIFKYLKLIIPIWVVVESGLGLAQVWRGQNVGGIFYWLGERAINWATPGVATMSVMGNEILRAYGTFSHPNSLAGFLLVALIVWSNLKFRIMPTGRQVQNSKVRQMMNGLIYAIGMMGILICGSRVVWGGILIYNLKFIIYNLKFKILNIKILQILCLGMAGVVGWKLVSSEVVGGWDSEGWQKRVELMRAGWRMWRDNPLFGVGMDNFLVRLIEYRKTGGVFWLQPIHNIPLLWLAETGMVGVGILILNLKFLISNQFLNTNALIRQGWWKVGVVVLVTSLVDHYWWSLPQNWWMLALVIGLSMRKADEVK